jgi:hypothetical protein
MRAAGAPLPPTELYNEGWMLRLVLDWLARHPGTNHMLAPASGARWASEGLLASPFLPSRRGDPLGEGFTHADGVVGHFDVQPGRGDIVLRSDATQLVVIEAKLGSPLSARTSNAQGYDQAARNVACIAHVAPRLQRPAFYVVAPRDQITAGIFGELVTRASVASKVRKRCADYQGAHDSWLADVFEPAVKRIEIGLLWWEDVLAKLPENQEVVELRAFYARCLEFNPPRIPRVSGET